MSGLLLIGVVLLWFVVAIAIARMLTSKLKQLWIKSVVRLLLVAVLIPLPVADEIVGGFQFRALCKNEAVATYDEGKIRGKTVHLKSADVYHFTNTILPTYKQTWKYADHTTNEELISYVDLHSDGGWLSRAIHFNYVHKPYTFTGVCSGDKDGYLFQNLNIKKVNKSSGE